MAIAIEGELAAVDLVAALHVADEAFAAIGNPFDRAAEAARGPQHKRLLRIGDVLGAEAAADVPRNHTDVFRRNAEHVAGERALDRVRLPGRRIQRVAASLSVVCADIAAGLERRGRKTRIYQLKP